MPPPTFAARAAVCAALLAPVAAAQEGPARPAYRLLRFEEDWSALSEGEPAGHDLFDPIKHVPLNEDGSWWASFGGQMRGRLEVWDDFHFGAPPGADHDDAYALLRLFAHADLHFGERVRAFVEAKSALAFDRDLPGGRRTSDVDQLDLQNAFVDVSFPVTRGEDVVLRAGRQELSFGRQRLVSPLDWSNTRRTFQGISAIAGLERWRLHGFATHLVEVDKYDFNESDDDVDFAGLYATLPPAGGGDPGLELYWLFLRRESASFNGDSGEEERHTLGGRTWGPLAEAFDYELEVAGQVGEVGDADVRAYTLGAELGWRIDESPCKPRVSAGLELASGDEEAGDGKVETFNQLFPLGHGWLGYIDEVGRQNIVDLHAGASFQPRAKLTAEARLHVFRLFSDDDALYNAGGGRTFGPSGSRDVGQELDLTLVYKRDRHSTWLAGYSHFFAGEFLEDTSPGEDVDFVYLQFQYTF